MGRFIAGAIFGIVVATIGFTGIVKLLDNGVSKVKETVKEQSNK